MCLQLLVQQLLRCSLQCCQSFFWSLSREHDRLDSTPNQSLELSTCRSVIHDMSTIEILGEHIRVRDVLVRIGAQERLGRLNETHLVQILFGMLEHISDELPCCILRGFATLSIHHEIVTVEGCCNIVHCIFESREWDNHPLSAVIEFLILCSNSTDLIQSGMCHTNVVEILVEQGSSILVGG